MTTLSYPNAKTDRKTAPADEIIKFDVIANGTVYHHEDILSASICCRKVNGRLFRVVPDVDKPNGYYRERIEPLTLAFSPAGQLLYVPVFGR